jgi:carbamoyltransferase
MKILSFYVGLHDSNMIMYDADHNTLKYIKTERMLGLKRHRASLQQIFEICGENHFIPNVICYSDGLRNGLMGCSEGNVVESIQSGSAPFFRQAHWYTVDHHFAHVMSVWPVVPTKYLDVGFAIDGRGDHDRRISIFRTPQNLGPPVYFSKSHQVGHLFGLIGERMGLSGHIADHAGKIMGLQAYGKADSGFVASVLGDETSTNLFRLIDNFAGTFKHDNSEFRDWIAGIHEISEEIIVKFFEKFADASECICYSGGCALNTVINRRLRTMYPGLHIPPHAYDGGLSLGLLEVARLVSGIDALSVPEFPFIQSDEDFGYASDSTIDIAANFLAQGKTVAWLQGRGEIGPRALGHRSFLINPSLREGKTLVNAIKKREYWRPFAPSVLKNHEDEYFIEKFHSPHMLYAVNASELARTRLQAAVHVDNTARVQIVTSSTLANIQTFEKLLEGFHARTGIGGVLNTSLNAAGEPIISTREQAMLFFNNSGTDVMVMGDKILLKRR